MRQIVCCSTCRFSPDSKFGPDGRTGGEILAQHVRDVLDATGDITSLATQACLWNCTRPCSVVLQDTERFSYATGGHEPTAAQAEAIVAWFRLHGGTDTGEVPFKTWPDRMCGHFLVRIPKVPS